MLSKEASAIAWIHDAFAHLKVIGSTPEAKTLLDAAGVLPDQGVKIDSGPDAFLNTVSAGRIWEREPSVRAIF